MPFHKSLVFRPRAKMNKMIVPTEAYFINIFQSVRVKGLVGVKCTVKKYIPFYWDFGKAFIKQKVVSL